MANFDDLSKEQQDKLLEIADRELEKEKIQQEYRKHKQERMRSTIDNFLSKDKKYSEDKVPVNTLEYDEEKVIRVQNNSGQFIERATITFDNQYQLSVLRPPQEYGSDPSLFDVAVKLPDGETKDTVVQNQTIADINYHIKTVSDIKISEPKSNDDDQ